MKLNDFLGDAVREIYIWEGVESIFIKDVFVSFVIFSVSNGVYRREVVFNVREVEQIENMKDSVAFQLLREKWFTDLNKWKENKDKIFQERKLNESS